MVIIIFFKQKNLNNILVQTKLLWVPLSIEHATIALEIPFNREKYKGSIFSLKV